MFEARVASAILAARHAWEDEQGEALSAVKAAADEEKQLELASLEARIGAVAEAAKEAAVLAARREMGAELADQLAAMQAACDETRKADIDEVRVKMEVQKAAELAAVKNVRETLSSLLRQNASDAHVPMSVLATLSLL